LNRPLIVVGRDWSCDVRLDSPRVSRRHCCVTEVDGGVWVRDLGSTNGIRIRDQRVSSGRLRIGDVLAIAHVVYWVVEEFGAGPASGADHASTPNDGRISFGNTPGTALFDES
jgi:pSer/pThr/pTyr-binding forkhead associated (FHA) protein